jgi:hypothetical protein
VSEARLGHAMVNIGNMITQPFGEIGHATDYAVGVDMQFFPQFSPVVKPDAPQAVFTANFIESLTRSMSMSG